MRSAKPLMQDGSTEATGSDAAVFERTHRAQPPVFGRHMHSCSGFRSENRRTGALTVASLLLSLLLCRLSGVHASMCIDRRRRWRVINTYHHYHHHRQWYGGFNDCQTATTPRSDFHANKALLACIIGESRECRSGADVQLQQQHVPPAQEGSRAEACFRGA
jgi:hypothetical protein